MKYYAGIGARGTPEDVQEYLYKLAAYLSRKGYTLRSGGANGSDRAFELGCDKVGGSKEIFLPWWNFNESTSNLIVSNTKAYDIAEKHHPYWHNLSVAARKLQSRNTHQILGWDLETPSHFVICWTEGGKRKGGTGQALRLAEHYHIPIFDAGLYDTIDSIKENLKEFFIENDIFSEEELSK